MKPGLAQVNVQAENYLASERELLIADSDDPQRFTVELIPVEASDRIALRLPGGAVAVGAHLILMDSTTMSTILWSAQSDVSGEVRVPRVPGTILLVRHPLAGSIPLVVTDGAMVGLPAAGPPMAARFVDTAGAPARYAGITVWIRGVKVFGGALSFLYGVPNATNAEGIWRATNLPAEPFRIAALTARAAAFVAPDALDALASSIPYPWPDLATFRAAE